MGFFFFSLFLVGDLEFLSFNRSHMRIEMWGLYLTAPVNFQKKGNEKKILSSFAAFYGIENAGGWNSPSHEIQFSVFRLFASDSTMHHTI